MAKHIIKFVNEVARVINDDPITEGRLRIVFVPDYNVSAMELICPAADLSEQISTAGKEASGTGNMKLMMNGAVTIGTLDGANIEIREAVGDDNFFLFGLTVQEIEALRNGYDPMALIGGDVDLARIMELIEQGVFNGVESNATDAVLHAIKNPHDQWMTAADFRSFVDAQQRASAAYQQLERWTRMSILNTAASGRFSTDRTMRDYNRDIWHLSPVCV
jgi:starch phosphorylase